MEARNMMPSQDHAACDDRLRVVAQKDVPSERPEPRFYREPRLHQIGTIEQVQGRNFNCNKDLGNDYYYI
jgi:hypothetical protein